MWNFLYKKREYMDFLAAKKGNCEFLCIFLSFIVVSVAYQIKEENTSFQSMYNRCYNVKFLA